jgi:putative NADH-flavin reductase
MKILVIGAAGKTGAAVVDQAVAAGHTVTAFVHNAETYVRHDVQVAQGDALNPAEVTAALTGQEAVIDTLGGKTPYKESTLETDAARILIAAMQQANVRRLLVVSALGEGQSKANTSFVYEHLLMPTFLRGVLKDKAGMESEVTASNLDWTIVRAALLTDDEPTGSVRTYDADDGDVAHKITRSDLATFLVNELPRDTFSHKSVTVANV